MQTQVIARLDVRRALEKLEQRDQTALKLYYGFDGEAGTYELVGAQLGVRKERAAQIIKRAYKRLRAVMDAA